MKNILKLAQSSKQASTGERNLLNKWFQDSIKSYFLESIAYPLIASYLNQDSSQKMKNFIHKQTCQNKPKYMEIIELYFFYINKFNQSDNFITKIQQILQKRIDIIEENQELCYKTKKIIRKQFVCFLILKYFQSYGQYQISSFYDLWNICFPQETQIKKKLTKFDKKGESTIQKISNHNMITQNDAYLSMFQPTKFENINNQFSFTSQQNISLTSISNQELNNINQQNVLYYENICQHQNLVLQSQNKPINNMIFEEESYEEEPRRNSLQINNNLALVQKEENIKNQN
ncbi:hypothetical protein ABPG73_022958 [Tetrahymena malaccensis]